MKQRQPHACSVLPGKSSKTATSLARAGGKPKGETSVKQAPDIRETGVRRCACGEGPATLSEPKSARYYRAKHASAQVKLARRTIITLTELNANRHSMELAVQCCFVRPRRRRAAW